MKAILNKVKSVKTIPWKQLQTWEFNDLKEKENRDVSKLKNSIINTGFAFPFFIWSDHKYVIDGNGRNIALGELEQEGYTIPDLPIVEIEAANLQEAKALVLKASSSNGYITEASFASFVEDIPAELYEEQIHLHDLDAFEANEEEQAEEIILPDSEQDDTVPEVPKEPFTVLGDIYEFEFKDTKVRLMCGDSTSSDEVEKLMNGNKADMVFTDPPYGAGFDIVGDKPEEFKEVFDGAMSNAVMYCDSTFIIASYYSCISDFVTTMKNLGFTFNEKIVWVKNLFGQGKVFHRKHEDFLFFSKGNHIKDFRNTKDDVMHFDSVRNFMGSKNAHEAVGHPTQKPTELLVSILVSLSFKGNLLLDLFGGSHSTAIACIKTGRSSYNMELDPKYVDVGVKRIINYATEQKLEYSLTRNGEKFELPVE